MFRAVRCFQRCRKGFSFPRIDPRRFLTVKERCCWSCEPVLLGLEQTIPPVMHIGNTGGHIIFERAQKSPR